jgi:hypothetical protein
MSSHLEKPHLSLLVWAHLLEVQCTSDSFLARHKKTGLFSRLIQVGFLLFDHQDPCFFRADILKLEGKDLPQLQSSAACA